VAVSQLRVSLRAVDEGAWEAHGPCVAAQLAIRVGGEDLVGSTTVELPSRPGDWGRDELADFVLSEVRAIPEWFFRPLLIAAQEVGVDLDGERPISLPLRCTWSS
jgi:hypothetical protein